MKTFYRVKQDNFLWKAGAIIKRGSSGGYSPIEDIWDSTPVNDAEYVSRRIIEHPDNAKYFERVYPDTLSGKLFKTKDQLLKLYEGAFKTGEDK